MTDNGRERFAGKVAIITGGASGIGLATARRLIDEGAHVMLGDLDADRLAELGRELGPSAAGTTCDVRVENDVETLVTATVEQFGPPHIVFANAGIGALAPIVDSEVSDWMEVIHVNLLGPLLTIKHGARRMLDGGAIVLTASLNAVQPAGGMSAYCCSKAGLAMLAQVAAMELGPRRIRVNAIGPGLVRTALSEGMWLLPSIVEEFEENAPLGTHSTPDEIANLVAFLASDEASSINGSLYLADGGAHTKRYPDLPAYATGGSPSLG